jgi:3-hydroxyacyl-CoA dehydrogenase, NAD binding domain/3-hydroxyacyl-CoA dehydrogenase, C-terminal domain
MKTVIIGESAVAIDIQGLFEKLGVSAIRVPPSDVTRSEAVRQSELIIDASSLAVDEKRGLLQSVAEWGPSNAIVCSDESFIPRQELLEGLDRNFRNRFAICHFFIPTANLSLVELVSGDDLDPTVESRLGEFLASRLQRSVMKCPDIPGFIANRIGLFFAFRSVKLALTGGLRPDQADRILATQFGVPKLGAFGLFDLVGFDVMKLIAEGLMRRLPSADAWHECDLSEIKCLSRAREVAGVDPLRFYRRDSLGKRMVLDLATLEFVPCSDDAVDPRSQAIFLSQLRRELKDYCAMIADATGMRPDDINAVLCKGFGWRQGPFTIFK